MSPGLATFRDLQLALRWQYEYLKGKHEALDSVSDLHTPRNVCAQSVHRDSDFFPHSFLNSNGLTRHNGANCPPLHPSGVKPPSLSSFDSGFDGAGNGHPDTGGEKTCQDEAPRPKSPHVHVGEGNVSIISEGLAEEKSVRTPSADSVNLEITVKRSATLPRNPWLSLPVDDLENFYTVIISPSQQRVTKSCNQLTQTTDTSMCDSQDRSTEWSPIRNVLSSTITDGGHGAETSENVPTLLWDSYDLHDLMHDTDSMILSQPECEWEIKEQQELRAVEETLSRAAGILKEEESVLVQEEILDVLLEAGDPDRLWPSWNKDCRFTRMTSSDLADAGVIGLEDDPASLNFGYDDVLSQKSPRVFHSGRDPPPEPGSDTLHLELGNGGPVRSELLNELENLKVLEEMIVEENLQINELQCCESEERTSTQSLCEDRKKFLQKLEQEKKEVEEMETIELMCPSRSHKIVMCSIMGQASVLREDDEALLINCRSSAQADLGLGQPYLEEPSNPQPSEMITDNPAHHECSDPEVTNSPECSDVVADSSTNDCLNTYFKSDDQQNIDSTASSISVALSSLMADGVLGCDVEAKEMSDSVSSVTNLSNPAIGEPKRVTDPVNLTEDKHLHLDPSETLDTTEPCNEDPKVESLTSEEVSSPAFDPGGPAPLLQMSRLNKRISTDSEENASDAINQTAVSTAVAPSVDAKELKNPPCGTLTIELKNQNTNNNNHHAVDLRVGSKKVSEEPVGSECITRAEDQKPEAWCDGLISRNQSSLLDSLEPCGAVENNEAEVHCADTSLTRSVCRSPVQLQLHICTREVWAQFLMYFSVIGSIFTVLEGETRDRPDRPSNKR